MLYRQMKCFLEVANTLSFTTAAQNLGMTQQAVTKQISALETDIGLRLFNRTTRKVELTVPGQVLRDEFTDIHRQMEEGIKRAKSIGQGKEKTVVIGFLSILARKKYILPVTERLFELYPDINWEVKLLDFTQLRNQLLDHKLDICITSSFDWSYWPDVKVRVLQTKPFEILFSKKHPLAKVKDMSLDSLKDQVQLTLPKEYFFPGISFFGKKIPCRKVLPSPDIPTMLVWLESGQGFSMLTRVFEGLDSEDLCYWKVPFAEAHAEVVAICRNDASETVAEVVAEIEKIF